VLISYVLPGVVRLLSFSLHVDTTRVKPACTAAGSRSVNCVTHEGIPGHFYTKNVDQAVAEASELSATAYLATPYLLRQLGQYRGVV
jgi:hypothetical protein